MNHWYRVLLASLVIGLVGTGFSALFDTSLGTLDEAFAQESVTCCHQEGSTCYAFLVGYLIIEPGSYYSESGRCG